MFEELYSVFYINSGTLLESLHSEILQDLTVLEDEFERYFSELQWDELKLVENSFRLPVKIVPVEY